VSANCALEKQDLGLRLQKAQPFVRYRFLWAEHGANRAEGFRALEENTLPLPIFCRADEKSPVPLRIQRGIF
jgi:hypothetical protein